MMSHRKRLSRKRGSPETGEKDDCEVIMVNYVKKVRPNSAKSNYKRTRGPDLFMHCEDDALTNSQLHAYKTSVKEYNDAVRKIESFRKSKEWDSKAFDSKTNTFTFTKVVKTSNDANGSGLQGNGITVTSKNEAMKGTLGQPSATIGISSLQPPNVVISLPNIAVNRPADTIVLDSSSYLHNTSISSKQSLLQPKYVVSPTSSNIQLCDINQKPIQHGVIAPTNTTFSTLSTRMPQNLKEMHQPISSSSISPFLPVPNGLPLNGQPVYPSIIIPSSNPPVTLSAPYVLTTGNPSMTHPSYVIPPKQQSMLLSQPTSVPSQQSAQVLSTDVPPVFAVKTVLINQLTGQVYGEILNTTDQTPIQPQLMSSLNNNGTVNKTQSNQLSTNLLPTATHTVSVTSNQKQVNLVPKSVPSCTSLSTNQSVMTTSTSRVKQNTSLTKALKVEDSSILVDDSDSSIKRKFQWAWLNLEVTIDGTKYKLKTFIKKVKLPGRVLCLPCKELINYSSIGVDVILRHCCSAKHASNLHDSNESSVPNKDVKPVVKVEAIRGKTQESVKQPAVTVKAIKSKMKESVTQPAVVHPSDMLEFEIGEESDNPAGGASSNIDLERLLNNDRPELLKLTPPPNDKFENLPPGVKCSLPLIAGDNANVVAKMKLALDCKLAQTKVFINCPDKEVVLWMMNVGLLADSYQCPKCSSPCIMVTTVYSETKTEKMAWRCGRCCSNKSIRQNSFFESHPIKLQTLLILVYHWSLRSDTLKIFSQSKTDIPSSIRALPTLVNYWLALRRRCSESLNKIVQDPIGGMWGKVAIDSVIIPKGIIIVGAHEFKTGNVRFKVIGPSDYKSYKETLLKWISPETEVFSAKDNIKKTLNSINLKFLPYQDSVCLSKFNLSNYLKVHVNSIMSREFFSSTPVYKNASDKHKNMCSVSLKNTMKETIELMQLSLDEITWRYQFGSNGAKAFLNILKSIVRKGASSNEIALMEKSLKCEVEEAGQLIVSETSSPVQAVETNIIEVDVEKKLKDVENASKKSKYAENVPKKLSPKKTVNETSEFPKIALESYYYSRCPANASCINSLTTLDDPSLKCNNCKMILSDNVQYMKHVLFHIDNYRTQNSDLGHLTQCKFCFRTFNTPYNMQCHIDEVHKETDPNILICRICEIRFYDTERLIMHMRLLHKANEMPYTCEICMYRSSFYSDVMSHFNQVHRATNKLLCPYCLRVFSTVSKTFYFQHLLRHQNRKSSTLKGRCRQCCLSFVLDNDLKVHVTRAHADKPFNNGVIEKVDLRSTTMIPHPEKIPESMMYQVVNIQKMASSKPKPKHSQQNIKGATLAHYINGLNCLECDRSMGRFHFSKHMWCSKCPYSTFCMKSYSEHMINMHSLKARKMQCKKQIHRTMYCLCQFATDDMILMAKHLVSCGKKTCYPTKNHVGMGVLAQSATFPPLVVLDDEDEATSFGKKLVLGLKHSSGKNQSSSLATGLSLATQLAASNRTDKTPKIDGNNSASSDDSSKMLSVLGLMRKTETVVKSDGVLTDANNCNENKSIDLENSEKTVAEESIARDDDAEKESRDDIIASDSNDPTTVENDDCESDDQNVEVPEWDMSIQIVNVQSLANTENVEMI